MFKCPECFVETESISVDVPCSATYTPSKKLAEKFTHHDVSNDITFDPTEMELQDFELVWCPECVHVYGTSLRGIAEAMKHWVDFPDH